MGPNYRVGESRGRGDNEVAMLVNRDVSEA